MTKIKVTIDRGRWAKGHLFNKNNNRMCALGFLGAAVGIDKNELSGKGFPVDVDKTNNKKWASADVVKCLNGKPVFDEDFCHKVAGANDRALINYKVRGSSTQKVEERLIQLFESKGISLRFKGELPDRTSIEE